MCDGKYCEPHYTDALKGKWHLKYDHSIYHKQCRHLVFEVFYCDLIALIQMSRIRRIATFGKYIGRSYIDLKYIMHLNTKKR